MALAVKFDVGKFKPPEVIFLTLSHKLFDSFRVFHKDWVIAGDENVPNNFRWLSIF